MKRILVITAGLWIISILVVTGIIYNNENLDSYKININRIHSRLSNDWEANQDFLNNLSCEEKGLISEIEIINYNSIDKTGQTVDTIDESNSKDFFKIDNLSEKTVYLPLKGSSFLVKYIIKTDADRNLHQLLTINGIITLVFLIFIGGLIYIYKYIVRPMKRVSKIPEQLATGHIEKLSVPHKHQYFNDFIWGLDMLREQLQAEKNRNYKLEKERRSLVAGLSHDIKTPLSSIKNYTIALKEGIYEESEEQNKAFEIILNKTEIIEKLTKELLESSIEEINTSAVEVKAEEVYMSDIDQLLNQIIQQKIELLHMEYKTAELKEDLLVIANLDALSQVFDNIIENAVKYGDLNKIEVTYYSVEYYQCISIENTGNQIAENEIKHIFTSYYRGSNVQNEPGYGLGLYICKKMMKGIEGDIYARNTENGVSFVLVIPLAG
ncbi:MAG: sensor histidine kinase [Halothermotrichaceae bacterium]